MDKTQFLNELKQFKTKSETAEDVKDLIALYPYFTLAQLIQAKKESMHLFNLVVLFPEMHHLRNLFLQKKADDEITNKTQSSEKILQQRIDQITETKETEKSKESDEPTKVEPIQNVDAGNVCLDELIDKFNSNYPKISCSFEDSEEDQVYEDLCKSSVSEKMNIVTETLAAVYQEQGNYDKAIKIYKVLMIKYPEKSSIFANLITELKNKNSQKN